MIQKIKKHFVLSIATLAILVAGFTPALASAVAPNLGGAVCEGSGIAAGTGNVSCTNQDANGSIQSIASNVVNIFSVIVGVIAVIMLIYGGFRYITSGGDSNKVSSAKNTLIYAIIGLIVVALAQIIVHVVLTQTAKITG